MKLGFMQVECYADVLGGDVAMFLDDQPGQNINIKEIHNRLQTLPTGVRLERSVKQVDEQGTR